MIAEPATTAPPNFDRIARIYRWMEWFSFGPFLGLCRRQFLPRMRSAQNALIIGDGDGRFTARLLADNPEIRIQAIDASQSMLREVQRRAGDQSPRLETLCLDARNWRPNHARYDLIVTHFFLDCLSTAEVCHLAARIRDAAAPGAHWAVSDFATPPGPLGMFFASPTVRALYLAFAWMTGLRARRLPDHTTALLQSGFHLVNRRTRLGGLLLSEFWQLN